MTNTPGPTLDRAAHRTSHRRARLVSLAIVATLAAATNLAHAHIVLSASEGDADKTLDTSLRVTHGCDGSGTTSLTVRIPDDVVSVRPQYKAGWKLEVRYRPVDPPQQGLHGHKIDKAISEVTWSGGGPIPDPAFDTFGLSLKLPANPGGTVVLPTLQVCEKGRRDWSQPADSKGPDASPAPVIRIRGGAGSAAGEPMHNHAH